MIARPSSSTYVCLRCQSRLAKRHGTSLAQRAWQTTAARIEPDFSLLEEQEAPPPEDSKISHRPLRNHKAARNKPEERLWGFRGPMLSEDSEHLNVDVLGKPADVVVLRESKLSMYRRKKFTKELKTEEPIDIMKTLEKERGIPAEKEVLDNIDGLKPPPGKEPQLWTEWNNLIRVVEKGFTVSQLTRYLALRKQEKKPAESPQLSLSKHVRKITQWMPGTNEPSHFFNDNSSRRYMKASFTFKQNLALKILRECWKLELPEVRDGLGQQEINLDGSAFNLLISTSHRLYDFLYRANMLGSEGTDSVFRSIKNQYIFTSENMEAYQPRRTVRITAKRAKAEHVIQHIVEAVSTIEELHLPLKALEPPERSTKLLKARLRAEQVFNNVVLKELSNMTSTEITRKDGGDVSVASKAYMNLLI